MVSNDNAVIVPFAVLRAQRNGILQVPLLEARGLVKTYGHVQALRSADFEVFPGEIVALVGDNGAGKSTLVKALSGAVQPDAGTILIEGEPVEINTPVDAQRHGIETVYQDLALATDLDGSSNLFLGREVLRGGPVGRAIGLLDKKSMRLSARTAFAELGVDLQNAETAVMNLSGGQRQSVAVARAVAWASRLVFLDEPTAALGVVQTARVLDVVRRIRDKGVAVVLISHNMPEVLQIADRVEVLRLGRRVAQMKASNSTIADLVGAMTGAIAQEDASA
jgi:simple sugar transport system ATP-binding protein